MPCSACPPWRANGASICERHRWAKPGGRNKRERASQSFRSLDATPLSLPALMREHRAGALSIHGPPADLETEQYLLRIIDRVIFHKPVLHSRVNSITGDRKCFPIRTDIKHIVVECVRAIEVSRLAQRVRRRIAEARDIVQPRIARKTDGLDSRDAFCIGNAVGELFHKRKAVVRD